MKFLWAILAVLVVVFAFRKSVIMGIIVLLAGAAYLAYRLYPMIYAAKGQQAFQAGDYAAAKEYSEKVYNRMSFNQRVSYAYMLVRMGEYDRALEILDAYISLRNLDPKDKNTAKRQRCLAYYRLGLYSEALKDAQDVREAGYVTNTLYGLMGMLMLVLGKDISETTKLCEEAYDYDEDDRDIQDNVSICYYLQGDYDMAKEINGYVREENPEFTEGYYHGAQIAVKRGEYREAREMLDKIPSCSRTVMTTVSEEAVKLLSDEVDDLISGKLKEPFDTPPFTLPEAVEPDEYDEDDEEHGESIYDEYNKLKNDEEKSESIYDEINALEKGGSEE